MCIPAERSTHKRVSRPPRTVWCRRLLPLIAMFLLTLTAVPSFAALAAGFRSWAFPAIREGLCSPQRWQQRSRKGKVR